MARDYCLVKEWSASQPETTGNIIPTVLEHSRTAGDTRMLERSLRMADWLVSVQCHDGSLRGGKVKSTPIVPPTLKTGQILLGLAANRLQTARYLEPMRRAADWLAATQDANGCGRRFASPFVDAGERVYDRHVDWVLFEAARIDPIGVATKQDSGAHAGR